SSFSKNTRKHLKKSYRDGIYTKTLDEKGLDILYEEIEETALRAKIGHRPYSYFKSLYELFKDQIRLSVGYYQDMPVCSSLLLCYGNRATSLYGGSNDEYKTMGQNYQLNFEEIKYCIENNIRYYDMGGIFETDGSDGLYNFKKKFTEDNVLETVGELDVVIDQDQYDLYMKNLNPHYKREENESNRS
ncbi:peptidoglycan bridge formation glycyltransferase FemA/FemB family protein, partial [uncultured Anaerococcus sp.]|uniref:lipid II:glycine glycyltransferase FemX n=1 Tax=uncultured Anaerococcus sp. TaxID=293428 RepID=UPI002803E38B